MNLKELPKVIPGYAQLPETDHIKLIVWWAQTHANRNWVNTDYLRTCYGQLSRAEPKGGFSAYLNPLADRRPPHVLKGREGYKLEQRIADELSAKYGKRQATIHVEKLLTDLPQKVPNLKERDYLEETLKCLRAGAFRATVVMAWNLAYDHLCYWILGDAKRLSDFNTRSPIRFPGMKYPPVAKREDFIEMTEFHVIEIASSAGIITKNVAKVLHEKLTRRNMAAHPADVTIPQHTGEEVIRDLVENVVLNLQ